MALYEGVNGVARKVTKMYDGVAGVARKVTKAYDGVNGVARQYFSSGVVFTKVSGYSIIEQTTAGGFGMGSPTLLTEDSDEWGNAGTVYFDFWFQPHYADYVDGWVGFNTAWDYDGKCATGIIPDSVWGGYEPYCYAPNTLDPETFANGYVDVPIRCYSGEGSDTVIIRIYFE